MNTIYLLVKQWRELLIPPQPFDIQIGNYIFRNCMCINNEKIESSCPEDMALSLKFIADWWDNEN